MDTQPFVPKRHCQLTPISGAIGPLPEHFVVEEIPAYLPCGEGEHLFLWIEKRCLNTADVAKRISERAKFPQRDIGFAGMKDKNAVTRQWFSLVRPQDDTQDWDLGPDCRILRVGRHKNKLRTGHLIGNRFEITLQGVPPEGLDQAREIAQALCRSGYPNYFGPQRFGAAGRNLAKALAWLDTLGSTAEERSPRGGRRHRDKSRFDSKLLSSVLQSEVFNRYVAARLEQTQTLLQGEVVRLNGSGAHFVVEDAQKEAPRLKSGDLVLTGPMFGPKGIQARDEARELELAILDLVGLDEQHRRLLERHAPGTRRDLMLLPENLTVERRARDQLVLLFTLPAGAYATSLIREFTGGPWDAPRSPQVSGSTS